MEASAEDIGLEDIGLEDLRVGFDEIGSSGVLLVLRAVFFFPKLNYLFFGNFNM